MTFDLTDTPPARLTQYSHGAGCGCKIAPDALARILRSSIPGEPDPNLLIGHDHNDDAAAYDWGDGNALLSTTDFFTPIVDDPRDFGRIAATNALSDIYAMGGTPLTALGLLGFPINTLPETWARQIIEGAREICREAGIMLAGGHSIDTPEPLFGLAVTGRAPIGQLKRNSGATAQCLLYLTKPLGIGVLTTAEKRGVLAPEHQGIALSVMSQLNRVGTELASLAEVKAMTDVTGFGLLGHLLELCESSNLDARLWTDRIPALPHVMGYLRQGCIPGGTKRNARSYADQVEPLDANQSALLFDPQTSGGLLIAAEPDDAVPALLRRHGLPCTPIGQFEVKRTASPKIRFNRSSV